MSDRRTDPDLSQALTAWMDDVAPERPPARLLEETFTQTMGAEQMRTYPWHKVAIGSLGRGAKRSRVPVLLLAVVGLVVLAMAVGLTGGGPRGTIPTAPSPSPSPSVLPSPSPSPSVAPSAALPAPIAVTAAATVAIQQPIALVAAAGGDLWVMAPGRLDRIDPSVNAISGSAALGSTTDLYNGLATSAAGLWATNSDAALVYRVDPATLKVAATIPAGLSPKGVVATEADIWVADVHGGSVLRIDPATNKVVATITVGPTGNSGPNWLANGLGSIWVDIPNNETITRIDPVTNTVQATITAPTGFTPCGGIAVDAAAVWITGCSATNAIIRVDPSSNAVIATVKLGGSGYNPTLINGAPWISVDSGDPTTGMLVRVDPATNSIDRVLVPGASFGGGGDIVVADGSVWVVDGYNASVIRLPLTAFGP
jgi:virginiamycin B lyase